MNAPATPTALRELAAQPREMQMPDQRIDMFSLRGFELAQRIARAFATSDAVPAQFRAMVEKKGRGGSAWTENPAALGNCLVAIETARAIGMSITAVMQNANVIEGRLSWSGKFIIAAINASGRFTPLRFQIKHLGRMKASYREKGGWNDQKKGFDFIDKTVEVDNIECIAWAYTMEGGKATKERIDGAPVSIKMAVEEGWYSKSGSKWQTEMKHLMLQYRAGSFFGNIHAPDIVMGMGRTSEELADVTTIDVDHHGNVTNVTTTTEELRRGTPMADVVQTVDQVNTTGADDAHDEPEAASNAEAKPEVAAGNGTPTFDAEAFAERMRKCADLDALDLMADDMRRIGDDGVRDVLGAVYKARREELANAKPAASAQPVSRRAGRTQGSVE